MSHKLINLNPDLKRLRDEGYEINVVKSYLLVYHVPYVNLKKEVVLGVLVAPIQIIQDNRIAKPNDHTIHFVGEHPCDQNGIPLKGMVNESRRKTLAEGIEVDHYFSAKPLNGNYENFYDKITTYVYTLLSHAQAIDENAKAKTFNIIESTDPDDVFKYSDSNSSRAEIDAISEKLQNLKISIVGLGGTGSYILDFITKTHVKEIHLFDEDQFFSHNAFRAPGAASIDDLNKQQKKVAYHHEVYSHMRNFVFPHEYNLAPSNLDELRGMDFVFICIDEGEIKKLIIQKLMELGIPFIDTGVGIDNIDGKLTGSVRVTTGTAGKNNHIDSRISFSDTGGGDYNKNIQIAEINALNAALAVIKWKKLFGFYHDLQKEYHSVFNINCNQMVNDESINA